MVPLKLPRNPGEVPAAQCLRGVVRWFKSPLGHFQGPATTGQITFQPRGPVPRLASGNHVADLSFGSGSPYPVPLRIDDPKAGLIRAGSAQITHDEPVAWRRSIGTERMSHEAGLSLWCRCRS